MRIAPVLPFTNTYFVADIGIVPIPKLGMCDTYNIIEQVIWLSFTDSETATCSGSHN